MKALRVTIPSSKNGLYAFFGRRDTKFYYIMKSLIDGLWILVKNGKVIIVDILKHLTE